MIRLSPVRLIDEHGQQVGVVETDEAMRMAREAGLDLVEVQPDVRPPVCKITDYGKYKYELSKRENKGGPKQQELKEVRLGRSIKVDPHDIGIRVERARKFLLQGHKVLLVQQFRGREMVHKRLGEEIIRQVVERLDGLGKPDGYPRLSGRRMTLLLNPDRVRIEQVKRQQERDKAAAEPSQADDADAAKEIADADTQAQPRAGADASDTSAGAPDTSASAPDTSADTADASNAADQQQADIRTPPQQAPEEASSRAD